MINDAHEECEALANRRITDMVKKHNVKVTDPTKRDYNV